MKKCIIAGANIATSRHARLISRMQREGIELAISEKPLATNVAPTSLACDVSLGKRLAN
jgi:hypothetical protein